MQGSRLNALLLYRNCGAFLKITTKARALVNAEVEVIDSARIHPLSYKLACDVASAAIEGGGGVRHSEDAVNFNKALEEPAAVEDLNLEVSQFSSANAVHACKSSSQGLSDKQSAWSS